MAHGRESFAVVLARIAFTAVAYALLARVSLQAAVLEDGSSLLWLPAGVAVGLTYWWGYRVGLLGVALGAALTAWAKWGRLDVALLWAPAVCLGAFAGATTLRAWQVNPHLTALQDVAKFALIGAIASIISPAINTFLSSQYAIPEVQSWGLTTLYRWMGDWLGYLLMGSFLLVWWDNWRLRKRDYLALAGMAFLVGFAAWLSFYLRTVRLLPAPSLALLLPPMALGAFLYQQRGVTLLTLVAALLMATFAKGWDDAQPLEFRDAFFGWLFLAISFGTLMTLAVSITKQREYAHQLEQSRRELEQAYRQVRNILENAPTVAMQMYDEHGRILFWNRASEQFYGYTAAEALGKTLDALIFTPEEQEEFMRLLQRVRETKQPRPDLRVGNHHCHW
jgi:PAS domain-containing protein